MREKKRGFFLAKLALVIFRGVDCEQVWFGGIYYRRGLLVLKDDDDDMMIMYVWLKANIS